MRKILTIRELKILKGNQTWEIPTYIHWVKLNALNVLWQRHKNVLYLLSKFKLWKKLIWPGQFMHDMTAIVVNAGLFLFHISLCFLKRFRDNTNFSYFSVYRIVNFPPYKQSIGVYNIMKGQQTLYYNRQWTKVFECFRSSLHWNPS